MNIVIGIDPDSKASGVAVYIDGKLETLSCMSLMGIAGLVRGYNYPHHNIELHIEDVKAKKAVWHNKTGNQAAYGMTCQKVGMCKQVQSEIERIAEHFNVKIVKHKISSKWKNQTGKKEFEKLTGWDARSNEDTRSAAWFGFIGCK